jgi:uncharacterized delta-60 repeat protein
VKLTPTGLDTTFGQGGIATTALDYKGGSGEIEIRTQPDGKIIVIATVANAAAAADRDVAVTRLTTAGVVDTGFGDNGVRILDLGAGVANGMGGFTATDSARGLAIDAQGRIYVHAVVHAQGNVTDGTTPRTDTDYTVVRLTATGDVDTAWSGGDGTFTLDLYSGGAHSNATARGLLVLADGSVIGSGYANTAGLGTTQPVLFKLTPAGELDAGFADGGVFHDTVLALQTEVYKVALHGNKLVSGGYGRNTGTVNEWVSLRFDATTGARSRCRAVVRCCSGRSVRATCRRRMPCSRSSTPTVGSTRTSGPASRPTSSARTATTSSGAPSSRAARR